MFLKASSLNFGAVIGSLGGAVWPARLPAKENAISTILTRRPNEKSHFIRVGSPEARSVANTSSPAGGRIVTFVRSIFGERAIVVHVLVELLKPLQFWILGFVNFHDSVVAWRLRVVGQITPGSE